MLKYMGVLNYLKKMENEFLILENINNNNLMYSFTKGSYFISDLDLIKYLDKENFKNYDSPILIKNLDNINISELAQIKINIDKVGYFFVNCKADENYKEKIEKIVEEVKKLKNNDEVNIKKQLEKVNKVIEILNNSEIIYASFINVCSKNKIKFDKITINFPLLVLKKEIDTPTKKIEKPIKEEKFPIKEAEVKEEQKVDKPVKAKEKKVKIRTTIIEKPYFNLDFLINGLFATFLSFVLYLGFNLLLNDDFKGIFFIIFSILFIGFLYYSSYLIRYKDENKQKGKLLLLYGYISIGNILGMVIAVLITTFLLKLTYSYVLIVPLVLAVIFSLSAIPATRLIRYIINRIHK